MERYILTIICSLIVGFSWGQVYSLDKVLKLALEHNHSIKVLRNNVLVAENNADPGNAGMYPQLNLNSGVNYSSTDIKAEFLAKPNPVTIERDGAESVNGNIGLGLNWVIFDGLAMFYSYDKLKVLADLEDVKTRAAVENTLIQVVNTYYTMASADNNVKVAKESINITKDRVNRAKDKYEVGASSGIEYLSAEVDLNADSIALLNAINQLEQARNNLNFLVGNKLPIGFTVDGEVEIIEEMQFDELLQQANANNAQVLNAEYSKISSQKDLNVARAGYLPTVAVIGNYGFNFQENEVGNLLSSRNVGYSAGLTLSYPIFQGNQRKIRSQNAKVMYESSEELRLNAVDQLQRDLSNTWLNYKNNLAVLEMQERNKSNAEANFNRTREMYQLGKVTNVQFRDAQLNYLRTEIAIVNAKYLVRSSEFELIRLSGLLIKKEG